jgi:hypothetical protein
MHRPESYLDVAGGAIGGGYRVQAVQGRSTQAPIVFDTAADVAAAALLLGVSVLSAEADVRQACRTRGVRLLAQQETA